MLTEMRDTVGSVLLGEGVDPEKASLDQVKQAIDKIEKATKRRADPPVHRQRVHERRRQRRLAGDPRLVGRRACSWPQTTRTSTTGSPRRASWSSRTHADPGRGAARVHGARSSWTSSTTRRSWRRSPITCNYVPPVKGVEGGLEKVDPELAEQPADLPGQLRRRTTSRQFSPEDEAEIDAAFQRAIGA